MTAEKRAEPTPRPYEIRVNGSGEREIYAGEYGICIMYGGLGDKEEAANAALFVAAPDTAAERDRMKHERDLLAEAIGSAALKLGVWDGETPLNGPEVLMLLEDCVTYSITERDRLLAANAALITELTNAVHVITMLQEALLSDPDHNVGIAAEAELCCRKYRAAIKAHGAES